MFHANMFLFQFAQSGGRNGHFGFVYTISYTATECIFGCTDVIKPFLETQRGREVEIIRIYTEFITNNPTQNPSSNSNCKTNFWQKILILTWQLYWLYDGSKRKDSIDKRREKVIHHCVWGLALVVRPWSSTQELT